MLALFLHHEFVYRLTCRPLGVVSNILLICFCFHSCGISIVVVVVPCIRGVVRVYQSSTFEFRGLHVIEETIKQLLILISES